MYVVKYKSIGLSFLLIIFNSCQIYSSSFNTIFVPEKDVDLNIYVFKSHQACDINGCLKTKMLFFNHNPLIICPSGKMKLVFKDREGRFRVASSTMTDANPKLVEDCQINKTSMVAEKDYSPNYMKPTISSEQKKVPDMRRKNTILKPSVALQSSTIDSFNDR